MQLSTEYDGKYLPEITLKYRPLSLEKKPVLNAEDMVNFLLELLDPDEFELQEKIAVLLLDEFDYPIGVKVLFAGTRTSVEIDYRIVYQFALVCGVRQIVLAHNHPSGDIQPSEEDISSAARGAAIGSFLVIRYRDDVILAKMVGEKGVELLSMLEAGILKK